MKNRLIWDDCTPTRDRRPTTIADLKDDIHVEDYDSAYEVLEELCYLADYDSVEDFCNEMEIDIGTTDYSEIAEAALKFFSDPGDGSPNILYCKIDDKVLEDSGYYNMADDLDLDTVSKEEIIDYLIATGEFEDDDE